MSIYRTVRILAIETSCDETSIAVAEFRNSRGYTRIKNRPRIYADRITRVRVLSHITLSQIPVHKKFGGVVPNLAKREHQKNLVPILLRALKEAGSRIFNFQFSIFKQVSKSKIQKIEKILEREQELLGQFKKRVMPLAPPKLDAIAVTYGPGLAPALWVGVNFARALAYMWRKPLIPVNHMTGHFFSAFLEKSGKESYQLLVTSYPALALLVSGGHTELVLIKGGLRSSASSPRRSALTYKIVGETLDDAAGEAFDKVARILGLNYPGGPQISALAEISQTAADSLRRQQQKSRRLSAPSPQLSAFKLPRPMLNSNDYNFSFSGLKTAVLYLVRDLGIGNPSTSLRSIRKRIEKLRPLIAKEFQDAVVEVLVKKTIRAAKEYKVKTVLLGGGVAANKKLRKDLAQSLAKEIPNAQCLMPSASLTGDNALMIAAAAYFSGKKIAPMKLGADANAKL